MASFFISSPKNPPSMASFFIVFSLLLTFLTTTTSAINTTIDSPSNNLPPPKQEQLNSIIDAIVGAGNFSNWAHLLGKADPSIIPLTVTFFIPDDNAFLSSNDNSSSPPVDPRVFTYHIVLQRFSFSQLRQFPIGACLPTLLPENTLLITNNSSSNFTINGDVITHPYLFQNVVISVHDIDSVLDYTLFGKDFNNVFVSDPIVELEPILQPESEEGCSSSSSSSTMIPNSVDNRGSRGSRLHFNFILALSMVIFALFVLQSVGFDLLIQNKAIADSSDCKKAAEDSQAFIRFSSCNQFTMAVVESGFGLYLVMVLICATYAYVRGFHGPFEAIVVD